MLIPVRTISRRPRASAARTSSSTASGVTERSGPRARGITQYVQWNEQPSWTLMYARVRSTRGSGPADAADPPRTGSTPQRVGAGPGAPRIASSSASRAPAPRASTRRAVGSAAANGRGIDRDRAAGHHDLGAGMLAPRTPHRLARLLVRDRGDGARVDDDEVRGLGVGRDDAHTAASQPARDGLGLGVVHLAAEILDDGGPDGAQNVAHHSVGFVLISTPIVPTSAAIAYDT